MIFWFINLQSSVIINHIQPIREFLLHPDRLKTTNQIRKFKIQKYIQKKIYKTVSLVQVLGPLTSEYLDEPPFFLEVTTPLMNNSLNVSLNCRDIPQ